MRKLHLGDLDHQDKMGKFTESTSFSIKFKKEDITKIETAEKEINFHIQVMEEAVKEIRTQIHNLQECVKEPN